MIGPWGKLSQIDMALSNAFPVQLVHHPSVVDSSDLIWKPIFTYTHTNTSSVGPFYVTNEYHERHEELVGILYLRNSTQMQQAMKVVSRRAIIAAVSIGQTTGLRVLAMPDMNPLAPSLSFSSLDSIDGTPRTNTAETMSVTQLWIVLSCYIASFIRRPNIYFMLRLPNFYLSFCE